MSQSDPDAGRGKGRGLPILLVTVAALGAVQAAAWFYFRKQQPVTDELTRERLRRWSDT
jgi:hypothetical protein